MYWGVWCFFLVLEMSLHYFKKSFFWDWVPNYNAFRGEWGKMPRVQENMNYAKNVGKNPCVLGFYTYLEHFYT